jgi:hypothetical protein
MIGTRRRGPALGRGEVPVFRAGKQDFPSARGGLERVEVEGDKVIEEKALHLASKDVDL